MKQLLLASTAPALFAPLLVALIPAPLAAQTVRGDGHLDAGGDIVVSAPYIADLGILSSRSTVSGDQLLTDIKPQIGDLLAAQPGVSATSFAPGASRPVLRGFQGDRIRVLTDGIGTLDASASSADHGVAADPLTVERVEVFRGPASLLFGTQAVGGAVNILDKRIPRHVPEKGIHADVVGSFFGALKERSVGAGLDVALTSKLVAHVDASYRKTGDMAVGGHVLSSTLRAEQAALAAEALAEGHAEEAAEAMALADAKGRLLNSATENYTLGGGIALIDEGGSLGFSVSYYDSLYGVPGRPGATHAHGGEAEPEAEAEAVRIDMKQWRADMRGEILVKGPLIDSIKARIGYADYSHNELEGDAIGTRFLSQGFEGRLELVQTRRGGWHGVTGMQASIRDSEAIGAEAFIPAYEASQWGLFTLQQWDSGPFGIELAGRFDHSRIKAGAARQGPGADESIGAVDRSFNGLSGALGLSWQWREENKIGINASRGMRAPSPEELLSHGLHVATQSFELGDSNLGSEKSWGLELYARGQAGPVRYAVSLWHSWFDDFIYQQETGAEVEGLPVLAYAHGPARYWGMEAELSAPLIRRDGFALNGDLLADHVRATIKNVGPAPRIPPLRLRAGLDAVTKWADARVEVEHVTAQNRLAALESRTAAYTLVNASLSFKPFGADSETRLILSADNIFDVEARRHASFTKDFVPLAGRDIRLGVRFSF